MGQRGVTLIELVISTAIAVTFAVAALWLTQGGRAFGMRSATAQFDAALAYAQALAASSGNGATLVFDRTPLRSGFVLTIYSGRPNAAGALRRAPIAPLLSQAGAREAELGGVPFTVFLNSAGHASGMSGAVTASTLLARDPGCPSGESSIVLTLSDPRASDTRSIACGTPVAGAPAIVGTVAPDSR
jgi:prepilin-type N-terminal cleavage/methylation domain-containing protein